MKSTPLKQPTLLWADDDPDELIIMHEVLQGLGSNHKVIEATNGKQVLACLQQAKHTRVFPCLIVLDLNMPVLNGKETLSFIKQDPLFDTIPIVVFTTSNSLADRQYCASYGIQMLTKPITFNALKQVVEELLDLCDTSVSQQGAL
jgi:CheY-like chemotaxis protein